MGLLSKVFGIGGKGTIDITVDKPHYLSGELVTGSLLVQVREPIECNEVVVTVTGNESVHWPGSNSRYEDDSAYTYEEEFLQEKLILFNVQHHISPGNYVYPFEYTVPRGIPGSFDNAKEGGAYAVITYSITGALSIDGMLTKDLKKSIPFAVYQQWDGDITPISTEKTIAVRLMNLFNKGQCHVHFSLDKSVYERNQVATIQCDVENQSKTAIQSIQYDLICTVQAKELKPGCASAKVVRSATFPGTPASSQLSQVFPFDLKGNNLWPSTRGRVLSCSYRIEVTCKIPFCPDAVLALPITLLASADDSTTSSD